MKTDVNSNNAEDAALRGGKYIGRKKTTLAGETGGERVSSEAFETEKLSKYLTTALTIFRALGQKILG